MMIDSEDYKIRAVCSVYRYLKPGLVIYQLSKRVFTIQLKQKAALRFS